MSELSAVLSSFLKNIEETQTLWALQDESGEGWVVCDSTMYEDTDVMPLWSTEEMAAKQCNDEWQDFTPTPISVEEFLEYWVEDLNEDGVTIGIDWQGDENCEELEPVEFAKTLAEIEAE
ncbi:hypothetical protein HR45_14680 [Shewanella mangrovi]|uniref:DUF2750 domain-containing protein n=1 Tax=Shewanella mangrovi TaxID=1515746 RepID=A0A094JBS3_9GAMM|nr:DUF2750 domain-containing protein [Shewanella mangrovi]KFZ36702.1 hypothetical protein HR45_14680 [Shewanella mangrovi]